MSNKLSGAFSLDLEKAAEKCPELLDQMAVELFGEGATWATHKEQVLEYQRQLVKSMEGLNRLEAVFAKRREKISDLKAVGPGPSMDKFLSILEKAFPDKTLEERLGAVMSGALADAYEHSNRFGELGKAYEICAHVLGSADDKDVVDLLHKHFIEGKAA